MHAQDVPRPKILNTYFEDCGVVDGHNQYFQGTLALEEYWVTRNLYFQIWTTISGIGVTDLWRLQKRFRHDHKHMSMNTFENHMAFVLIKRAEQMDNEAARKNQADLEARGGISKVPTNLCRTISLLPPFCAGNIEKLKVGALSSKIQH